VKSLPRKPLLLLPGLRWQGKLRVVSRTAGGYAVEFDAVGIDSGAKQFIYDRAVLSPKQLADWTGWRE
jgi:hypothetical protein